MEEKDLLKGWGLLQPKRIMSDQMSIRLPVDVWVRVLALCQMFPGRTRTQIIGDLLSSALERVPSGLSNKPEEGEKAVNPGPYYGRRGWYEHLIEEYTKEYVQDGEWFYEDERRKRAPRGGGASARPTTTARPPEGTRGAPQRKRGLRRRPPTSRKTTG